jgi:hypothetical protein
MGVSSEYTLTTDRLVTGTGAGTGPGAGTGTGTGGTGRCRYRFRYRSGRYVCQYLVLDSIPRSEVIWTGFARPRRCALIERDE